MTAPADLRSLIVYATPTGPLADACARFFEAVSSPGARLGPTTAQTYPPHCTLTGFFRRSDNRARGLIASMGRMMVAAGPVPPEAVEVVGLAHHDTWLGLELRSPWLIELTAAIVAAHPPQPGEDALRPKDWLHLSLAYGVDEVRPYAPLAAALVDPALPAGWEVGVWERHDDGGSGLGPRWTRHSLPAG